MALFMAIAGFFLGLGTGGWLARIRILAPRPLPGQRWWLPGCGEVHIMKVTEHTVGETVTYRATEGGGPFHMDTTAFRAQATRMSAAHPYEG